MSFRIEVDEVFRVVRVEASGDLNSEVGLQIADEATNAAVPYGIKRFLYDLREVIPTSEPTEVYQLPAGMDKVGVDRSHKIAVVHIGNAERFRFFETVARNVGFDVCLFADVDLAMRWLTEDDGS